MNRFKWSLLGGMLLMTLTLSAETKTGEERVVKRVCAYYTEEGVKGSIKSEHLFDAKGQLTQYKCYYPSGGLQEEHTFTYDRKGRTTVAHHWIYRAGFKESLYKYVFDAKGKVTASFQYQNGAFIDQAHYAYAKKKPSVVYLHTPQGKLIKKEEFTGEVRSIEPLKQYPVVENDFNEVEYHTPQ